MEVIRTFKKVRTSRITLNVPASMRDKDFEIVFRPKKKNMRRTKRNKQPRRELEAFMKFVKANQIKLPSGYQFNREELHERGVL